MRFSSAQLICLSKGYLNQNSRILYRLCGFVYFRFAWAKGGSVPDWQFILGELLTGGLMAGAFFMATDYTTSPITKGGQIIYAVLMGFLTAVFRILGSSAEGVSYAIVISNLAVPLIEKISVPKPFGVRKKEEV